MGTSVWIDAVWSGLIGLAYANYDYHRLLLGRVGNPLVLERVRIQNYRCLRDVTLELGPLTVFVGPNASGKSAIADSLTATTVDTADYWHRKSDNPSIWTNPLAQSQRSRTPNILGGNRRKYVLSLPALRQGAQANEAWTLNSAGDNLANFFDTLSRVDQDSFVKEFIRLVPMYSDIKSRANQGVKSLQFQDRWQTKLWYEAAQVSDGTMLTAAFVALGFQRDLPSLAVIEDPDHGLHPYLQRHVITMLRDIATGKIGSQPIQIVCTTHSKALLDYLKPEEVRFITRCRDTGETVVQKAPVDNPNWKQVYDRFQNSLGNMWMTGSLGGVPGG